MKQIRKEFVVEWRHRRGDKRRFGGEKYIKHEHLWVDVIRVKMRRRTFGNEPAARHLVEHLTMDGRGSKLISRNVTIEENE